MARPFIIDENLKAVLNGLREYAESHPFMFPEFKKIFLEKRSTIAQDRNFSRELPFGYRVCFTLEQHGATQPLFKHLSMSVAQGPVVVGEHKKLPNPVVVEEVMKMLGITLPIGKCKVYIENEIAVNVIEIHAP